jgi:hypothetical protein
VWAKASTICPHDGVIRNGLSGHDVLLRLIRSSATRPRCQQVGPANHFLGPPEHVVLKGRWKGPSLRGGAGVLRKVLRGLAQRLSAARLGRRRSLGRFIGPLPRKRTHP